MGVQISKVDANKHLSIREAARRLLRCEISKFIVPETYSNHAHELILEVSDLQPGNIIDPIIETNSDEKTIEIYGSENKIVQLGGSEPDEFICWVPGSFELLWGEFCKYARALSEAGYPGCLNCGGRDAGEEWDEVSRRSEMANIS
jgi:hypothetical protein